MRLVIFGLIGLVAGLGGGVGFSIVLGGGDAEAPEGGEIVADTLAEAHADSTDVAEAAIDSTAGPDDTQPSPTALDSIGRSIASRLIRIPPRDSAASGAGSGAEPAEPVVSDSADASSGNAPGADPSDGVAGADDVAQDSVGPVDPGDAPAGDPVAAGATERGVDAQPSPDPQAGYRRVSRILAAMDAAEAALVLASLEDSEVRQLITLLPPRTAAAILAELDPARVARLSRGLFKPTGSS